MRSFMRETILCVRLAVPFHRRSSALFFELMRSSRRSVPFLLNVLIRPLFISIYAGLFALCGLNIYCIVFNTYVLFAYI